MIEFQDQIVLPSDRLAEIRQCFQTQYLPAASQRGMTLLETRISPPVLLAQGTVTLWYRWQVASIEAWWAMRAQAGTPDIARFWNQIDEIALYRERVYFSEPSPDTLPQAQATATFEVPTYGHRETAQLALKPKLSEADKAQLLSSLNQASQLPGLEAFILEANLAPDYAAGDYTLDLLFAHSNSAAQARKTALWQDTIAPALQQHCSACHALGLETLGAGMRDAGLKHAIKRTAFFRLLPGVDATTAQRFEQDLLEMPQQIGEIRNWRLSRAQPTPWNTANSAPWTYVWEQEFAQLDDLLGPYMTHPHHWAHIDRWFDPESGVQAVDTQLSHAFSPLSESLISQEARLQESHIKN